MEQGVLNMSVTIKKKMMDWGNIENIIGYQFYENYKEVYDVFGELSIDDLIYIVSPIKKERTME